MTIRVAWIVGIIAFLALPFVVESSYYQRLINLALIFAILSISLNIVLGYAGQIALGHAAFFGIGAYTSALIAGGASGLMFWPAFLVAGLLTGLFGILLGIPTLRLKGHYFAFATLGFGEIMRHIFYNWREVTHGMDGIGGIPAPSIGAFEFDDDRSFFYLAAAVLAMTLLFTIRMVRSKYGRRLAAIRDAEIAAGTSGIDVPRLKVVAFGLSAAMAGFAGSLYAHLTTYISPDTFIFDVTAQILSMVLIGGIGTIWGPVLGAGLLTFLPEVLRVSQAYYQLIYGAGICLLVIFLPTGLLGLSRLWGGGTSKRPAIVEVPVVEPVTEQDLAHMQVDAPAAPARTSTGNDPILVTKGLTCRFGGLVAIDELDLTVEKGTIHALIGPNGSGKSTFVNLMSGVYKATSGAIEFDGHQIQKKTPWEIANLGLVRTFQNLRVFRSLTVLENVLVGCRSDTNTGWAGVFFNTAAARLDEKQMIERAEEALSFVGLWHLRNRQVSSLPHEQQRVVEIARALVMRPQVIMLDEPAAGMNPTEVQNLIRYILRMRAEGITVLLIEHNMPMVMRVAERVTVLNFGKKICEGTPADVRTNDEVVKAYLGERLSKRLVQHANT